MTNQISGAIFWSPGKLSLLCYKLISIIKLHFYFLVGMFGKDEFEESKIGAVCLTMEDLVRMPFDFAFDVEGAEEKVYSEYAQ